MDKTYEIRNNYLFVKLTGPFDINRVKKNIYEFGKELHSNNLKKLFLDMTEVTGLEERQNFILESFDLYYFISKSHPPGTMISILGTQELINKHIFFENVMTNRGFPIKVTTEREEGLKWLLGENS